jgi:hypothetical protein
VNSCRTFPPGKRPQMRPQRGRCPVPAEKIRHRTVPPQVHVIDTVRPRRHPATRHAIFRYAFTPHGPPGRDVPRGQPGPRHGIRIIEGCVCPGQAMQQSHLTGALSKSATEASDTPIVPVQTAPFALTRPETALIDRWIEA